MRWLRPVPMDIGKHPSKFSRKDFTQPQLFACLVLREHQKRSYRGLAALLDDCPEWRADIGLKKVPGHNTLCRAFHKLVKPKLFEAMLDRSVQAARQAQRERKKQRRRNRQLRRKRRLVAIDSTMFESHHVSRHFERRCRQTSRNRRRKARQAQADRQRSAVVKGLPKLSLGVQASSHFILSARATTGGGADYKHFAPLLTRAVARRPLDTALADAGYDSESNHRLARFDLGVRTLIPAISGRPGSGPPTGYYRRLMRRRFARRRRRKPYGQRWQVETVNSMIKRNLGSACRAHTPRGRRKDMLLRVLTHNIMLLSNF